MSTLASADDAALVTEIVDTFYKIYGNHPGFRVNHAKGVVAKGSFVATKPRGPLRWQQNSRNRALLQ
jgi:catalase